MGINRNLLCWGIIMPTSQNDPRKLVLKNSHHRHSNRLKGYDYSQSGAYFITIYAHDKVCLFGDIVDDEMRLNDLGLIVETAWFDLPNHYSDITLDSFCIMPNHIHAVIVSDDSTHGNRTQIVKHPLSEIVRAFKSFSARRINELRDSKGVPVWQRDYYDHIIRDEKDYYRIYEYIDNNPLKWLEDEEFSI